MDILDGKYADLKIVGGKIVIEVPLVELLKELALKTGTKLDDKLVELLEAALEKQA